MWSQNRQHMAHRIHIQAPLACCEECMLMQMLVLLCRWQWSSCVSRLVALGMAHVVMEQQLPVQWRVGPTWRCHHGHLRQRRLCCSRHRCVPPDSSLVPCNPASLNNQLYIYVRVFETVVLSAMVCGVRMAVCHHKHLQEWRLCCGGNT